MEELTQTLGYTGARLRILMVQPEAEMLLFMLLVCILFLKTRQNIGASYIIPNFKINYAFLLVLREEFRLEPVSTQSAQGETVILECSPPRGSPEPSVYWKKNGQILHFDGDSRYVHCTCKFQS